MEAWKPFYAQGCVRGGQMYIIAEILYIQILTFENTEISFVLCLN